MLFEAGFFRARFVNWLIVDIFTNYMLRDSGCYSLKNPLYNGADTLLQLGKSASLCIIFGVTLKKSSGEHGSARRSGMCVDRSSQGGVSEPARSRRTDIQVIPLI